MTEVVLLPATAELLYALRTDRAAHTLAQENASNALLRRLGFRFAGEVSDPEEGIVWRWERGTATSD